MSISQNHIDDNGWGMSLIYRKYRLFMLTIEYTIVVYNSFCLGEEHAGKKWLVRQLESWYVYRLQAT